MCNIFNEMQFSISASEIIAEFWIILASFGHFIDKKFKSERNPRIGYYRVFRPVLIYFEDLGDHLKITFRL